MTRFVAFASSLLLAGCGGPLSLGADAYCPDRITGETLAEKASHALTTCAPMIRFTLDSYVPRWETGNARHGR